MGLFFSSLKPVLSTTPVTTMVTCETVWVCFFPAETCFINNTCYNYGDLWNIVDLFFPAWNLLQLWWSVKHCGLVFSSLKPVLSTTPVTTMVTCETLWVCFFQPETCFISNTCYNYGDLWNVGLFFPAWNLFYQQHLLQLWWPVKHCEFVFSSLKPVLSATPVTIMVTCETLWVCFFQPETCFISNTCYNYGDRWNIVGLFFPAWKLFYQQHLLQLWWPVKHCGFVFSSLKPVLSTTPVTTMVTCETLWVCFFQPETCFISNTCYNYGDMWNIVGLFFPAWNLFYQQHLLQLWWPVKHCGFVFSSLKLVLSATPVTTMVTCETLWVCFFQPETCFISNTCYNYGDLNPDNETLVCDSYENYYQWSILKGESKAFVCVHILKHPAFWSVLICIRTKYKCHCFIA